MAGRDEAEVAKAILAVFAEPKQERLERPWSRLQIEVRREFVEAQRARNWGR